MIINGQKLSPLQEVLWGLRSMGLGPMADDVYAATEGTIGEAEERGARRLAEYIVNHTEHPATSVEDLMTIWRGLKE